MGLMAGYRTDPPGDPDNPRPRGRCDRCDFVGYLDELKPQMAWAANRLINTQLLVCSRCLDVPQPQDRVFIFDPDPPPVKNPRPEPPAPES
jgi:hypothetical protein